MKTGIEAVDTEDLKEYLSIIDSMIKDYSDNGKDNCRLCVFSDVLFDKYMDDNDKYFSSACDFCPHMFLDNNVCVINLKKIYNSKKGISYFIRIRMFPKKYPEHVNQRIDSLKIWIKKIRDEINKRGT